MTDRPSSLLHRLRSPLPAALVGMALCLPSLVAGRQIDDHLHRLILGGSVLGFSTSAWDLFTFMDGDPVRAQALMDRGIVPWWVVPELRVAFLRPLSVITHIVDHRLWPDSAPLAHLQSLLWYGVLVLAAGAFYQRLLGPSGAAGLAVLLFAVDDAHGMTVGWLANRNALVAMTLGVASLLAHDAAARRSGGPCARDLAGPLLFAAALLGAEAGIATLGYVAAHALFLDGRPARRRLAVLVPYGIVAVAWYALYRRLGCGAWGSGLYLDPAAEPGPFLLAACWRIPVLLLGELAFPPSDVANFVAGAWLGAVALGALLVLAFIAFTVAPLLRRHAPARFFALGMLLSLLPVAATFPSDRLLLFAGLGGTGLVACGLHAWRSGEPQIATSRRTRILAVAWILIHGILAPVLLPLRALTFAAMGQLVEGPVRAIDAAPGADVVLLNPLSDFIPGYLPVLRESWGEPVPRHTRCLALGLRRVRLERTDERTLVLTQEGGLLLTPWETLMRGPAHPMAAGQRVALSGMTATILGVTPDGRPERIAFSFDRPLEDPTLAWYVTSRWSLDRWQPPAVGSVVDLPGFP